MINKLTDKQVAFIKYLTSLNTENNRGTLATLRRGLAGHPFYDLNMRQFIAGHIPEEDRDGRFNGTTEMAYYLLSSLYASHPYSTQEGNFGNHLRTASGLRADKDAAERRFTALLNARLEDLHQPLRQALNMLDVQHQHIPVNWMALFADLLDWEDDKKSTQRSWANGFWAYEKPVKDTDDQSILKD